MSQKYRKNSVIVIDQELVKSQAWLTMSGAAWCVYLIFRCKCKWGDVGKKGHEKKIFQNNGQLIFPYREAVSKFGFTVPRFLRSLDLLVETGFLDIAEPGNAALRQPTRYGISERWRKHGTSAFEKSTRSRSNKVGWLSSKQDME